MKKLLLSFILALFVAAPLSPFMNVAQAGAPLSVNTAIRGTSTDTVYWYANDGKRYVFPNASIFYSWFPDFNNVRTILDSDLYAITIGGNVTYRPGAKLIKVTTDPKVYAVARGGILRHVTSESLASQLFGYDWNSKIVDVPDSYFTNYAIGTPIYNAYDYNVSNEYNGVTNPSDSLRGVSSSNGSIGDITLNASRTSINPGEAVVLSVSNVPNYGSSYRLEIYDTRNNGLIRTCYLPTSYCDVTVYPQRNSTENSVQYYAALRDYSALTVKSGYAPVIYFGNVNGTNNTGTLTLNADRTTITSGQSLYLTSSYNGTLPSGGRLVIKRDRTNETVSTCYVNTCNVTVYPYQTSGISTTQYYAQILDVNGNNVVGTSYSPVVTFTDASYNNGTLVLNASHTTVRSGEVTALTVSGASTLNMSRLVFYSERDGVALGTCYSTSCQHYVTVTGYDGETVRYRVEARSSGDSLLATAYVSVRVNGSSTSYNNGTNFINGLVLNADRTSINPNSIVRLTANAYHAGTWSYTGNRISITDMRTNLVVKTCYDVSTCTVDVYPQAYSSTNLTSQYQAKIYDRNGVLAMSQYSPVIYLSSYSGTTYNDYYGYPYTYSYTQTTGRGLVTIAPTANLRTNQMVYLTVTFADTNIPLEDSVVKIYTERSSTALATCTASRTCTVSFPTGTDPINTRVYGRLTSRSLNYTTLESERVNMVTTR